MNMQASLLAAALHAAEVSRLERAEEELGQEVRRQLQEKQGM